MESLLVRERAQSTLLIMDNTSWGGPATPSAGRRAASKVALAAWRVRSGAGRPKNFARAASSLELASSAMRRDDLRRWCLQRSSVDRSADQAQAVNRLITGGVVSVRLVNDLMQASSGEEHCS